MKILIPELAQTALLGRVLAGIFSADSVGSDVPFVLLLHGDLGAGKTTLVRHLVESLPGGDTAEVSSPSFTLCNSYDTSPPVQHFDLYRLEPWQESEELIDALEMAENRDFLLIIEWPERMKKDLLPGEFLYCSLTGDENNRTASFASSAENALRLIEKQARDAGLAVEA